MGQTDAPCACWIDLRVVSPAAPSWRVRSDDARGHATRPRAWAACSQATEGPGHAHRDAALHVLALTVLTEMAYAALNKAGDGPTQTRWGADHNAGATPEVLMALTEENNVSTSTRVYMYR